MMGPGIMRMLNSAAVTLFVLLSGAAMAQDTIVQPPPQSRAAPDSQLCRSQLDLLTERNKLTTDEAAVFEAQCSCLELQELSGKDAECAQ